MLITILDRNAAKIYSMLPRVQKGKEVVLK
jgi:hypothetical protein